MQPNNQAQRGASPRTLTTDPSQQASATAWPKRQELRRWILSVLSWNVSEDDFFFLIILRLKCRRVLALSHVWLFCNPMDCSPPGTSVHGILQARILEWVAIPFSRGSSPPRDWTWVSWNSCIAGRFFTIWATREGPKAGAYSIILSLCVCANTPSETAPSLHINFLTLWRITASRGTISFVWEQVVWLSCSNCSWSVDILFTGNNNAHHCWAGQDA